MPPLMVKISDVGSGVHSIVEQSGGDDDLAAAAARFVNREADFSDGECLGHAGVGRLIHPVGACWPPPENDVVIAAQAAAAAEIVMTLLMQAKSRVGAALLRQSDHEVGAVIAIADHDVIGA